MEVRYELLRQPEPTTDGSGIVKHDIQAVYTIDNVGWLTVPSHHKDICIPSDALAVVMSMPQNNAAARQAKVAAYKELLVSNRFTQPIPYLRPDISDWSKVGIEQYLSDYEAAESAIASINADAFDAADAANIFITVTLNQSYPVRFAL